MRIDSAIAVILRLCLDVVLAWRANVGLVNGHENDNV